MKGLFYYCINSSDVKKVEMQVPYNLKDNEDYTKYFKTKIKEEINKKNYSDDISDNNFNFFNLKEILKNVNKTKKLLIIKILQKIILKIQIFYMI